MRIAEVIPHSMINFNEFPSAVIFSPGCNFFCPACHAGQIIKDEHRVDEEGLLKFLAQRKSGGWIKGVVITGGEPTLQVGLAGFLRKVKELGLKVKLDTNGSNPEVLENLAREKLVDYVALDVKARKEDYSQVIGREFDAREFEKSVVIATRFPDYEFRTTVVPVLREFEDYVFPEYMNAKEVVDTAKIIVDTTGNNQHKYFLQPFVARSEEEMVDKRMSKESLEKLGIPTQTPRKLLEECCEAVKIILPNCKIRGD